MQLPIFFEENFSGEEFFLLSEEASKHIVQVLRMQENDSLLLTNGKGQLLTGRLVKAHKKKAEVQITNNSFVTKPVSKITIGISLIKNTTRFEWFLEKATELGVSEIIPLLCQRTEKQHFRYERMKNILVSAMLQSQQAWLPELHSPVKFEEAVQLATHQNKYIAHCLDNKKNNLTDENILGGNQLILIGPEGDFTEDEIETAFTKGYIPVSLGENRLRTETAGIVAAVSLLNKLIN